MLGRHPKKAFSLIDISLVWLILVEHAQKKFLRLQNYQIPFAFYSGAISFEW